ncbi:class I SAM-dependent methyltransferase [uncultured Gimesia sp.]|uniref:class I SAM-dependent methyltransferase n=1 Tax=uncultured Gimesia sp. TaxID=1678688 RepID=UPI002639BB5E|nr:class I SAM-dependent methyltransferase [uncultured Gimesia sp.]
MTQQDQTYRFFKSHAKAWQVKAEDEVYSTIQNRHLAVFETMKKYPNESSLLDVGCGTGQLAIEASNNHWHSLGLDFADDMIEIAKENNKRASASAEFICGSIFEFKSEKSFDVISAQGFIEYISLEQLDEFLAFLNTICNKGGAVAIGSRNRLFNVHSINQFTQIEKDLGTLPSLIEEAIAIHTSSSQEEAIECIRNLNSEYVQPDKHPLTGIGVDTRYQFTPSDLANKLENAGFTVTSLYPVHLHPFPVNVMDDSEVMGVHKEIARFASEKMISNHRLVPYSSSYVIEAINK